MNRPTCRQMYISTGEAAAARISWDQLGNIIDHAKPFLRDKK